MLRIVTDNERPQRSPEFSRGFHEGLRRIAGITQRERTREEWFAMLTVFKWVTKQLENKVKSFDLDRAGKPKLRIVENQ